MTCVHCGETTLSRVYSLRFAPARRQPTVLDLRLCTTCLLRFRAAPDIKLVSNPVVVTAE